MNDMIMYQNSYQTSYGTVLRVLFSQGNTGLLFIDDARVAANSVSLCSYFHYFFSVNFKLRAMKM